MCTHYLLHYTCTHTLPELFPCNQSLDTGTPCPPSSPIPTPYPPTSVCPSCAEETHLKAAITRILTDASLAPLPQRSAREQAKTRDWYPRCGHYANVTQQDFGRDGEAEYVDLEMEGSCPGCCEAPDSVISEMKQYGQWGPDPWGEMDRIRGVGELVAVPVVPGIAMGLDREVGGNVGGEDEDEEEEEDLYGASDGGEDSVSVYSVSESGNPHRGAGGEEGRAPPAFSTLPPPRGGGGGQADAS